MRTGLTAQISDDPTTVAWAGILLCCRGVLQPEVNFLSKPIAMNKLLLKIREVLEA